MRRLQSWAIEEQKDSSFTLTHGNRPVATGLHHKHAVLDYITSHSRPGERVYSVEPDGYRTEITRQLLRSKVIAAAAQKTTGTGRRLRAAAAQKASRRRGGTA